MSKEKEFTTAERIALTVAFEALRQRGWSDQPEMLFDKILPVRAEGENRQYKVLFALFGERQSIYEVGVCIRKEQFGASTRWADGVATAFHWIAKTPWIARFKINWVRGTPRVKVETFA